MSIQDKAEQAKDKAREAYEDVKDHFDGDDEDDFQTATPADDGTY